MTKILIEPSQFGSPNLQALILANLAQPAQPQQEPAQETLQQQLEKAEAALYNARADIRRIQQIIMRQS